MASVTPTTPSINASLVLGPLFLGTLWNWTLLGSLVLQVYSYAQVHHKHDRPGIKWLVYTTLIIEIFLSVFLVHLNFDLMISKWGIPTAFLSNPWSGCTVTPGSGVVAAMVQIFFAWRIWMLNKHVLARISTVVIVILAVLQASASIALTIVWKTQYQFNDLLLAEVPILKRLTLIWLGGSFAVDALIATAMILSLVESRRELRQGLAIRNTETLLNRLIGLTIETGVITAVTALIDLSLYLLPTQGQIFYSAPAIILGKLYSNVLMANLNGRARSAAFKAGLQASRRAAVLEFRRTNMDSEPYEMGTTYSNQPEDGKTSAFQA